MRRVSGQRGVSNSAVVALKLDLTKAHAVAVAHSNAVAVLFHFVEPVRTVRDLGRSGGEAKIEGAA